jgi:hypothetical protein
VKIAKTDQLARINHRANELQLNRALSEYGCENLDPDGIHVMWFSMIHNDDHMRTCWLLKMRGTNEPVNGDIDMTFDDYESLADYVYDKEK